MGTGEGGSQCHIATPFRSRYIHTRGSGPKDSQEAGTLPLVSGSLSEALWPCRAGPRDELQKCIAPVLSRVYSSGRKYSQGSLFLVLREQVSHPACCLSQVFIQDSFLVDLSLPFGRETPPLRGNRHDNGPCCHSKSITPEGGWNLRRSQVFVRSV